MEENSEKKLEFFAPFYQVYLYRKKKWRWCCSISRPKLKAFGSATLTAHLKPWLYLLNQYSGSCFDNFILMIFLLEGRTKGKKQSFQQGPKSSKVSKAETD